MCPRWVIGVAVEAKGFEAELFFIVYYFIGFAGGCRVELFLKCFVFLYSEFILFSLANATGYTFAYFFGGGVHFFGGGVHLGCFQRSILVSFWVLLKGFSDGSGGGVRVGFRVVFFNGGSLGFCICLLGLFVFGLVCGFMSSFWG